MFVEPVHLEDLDSARDLYLTAFPEYERCAYDALLRHTERSNVEWLGVYDNGFRGMAYTLYNDEVLFILYLAICEGNRGLGLGSRTLEEVRARHPGLKTFLNIEPPDEPCDNPEQRMSRKRFYERNGFRESGRLSSEGDNFIIMCHETVISPNEIRKLSADTGLNTLFTGGLEFPE